MISLFDALPKENHLRLSTDTAFVVGWSLSSTQLWQLGHMFKRNSPFQIIMSVSLHHGIVATQNHHMLLWFAGIQFTLTPITHEVNAHKTFNPSLTETCQAKENKQTFTKIAKVLCLAGSLFCAKLTERCQRSPLGREDLATRLTGGAAIQTAKLKLAATQVGTKPISQPKRRTRWEGHVLKGESEIDKRGFPIGKEKLFCAAAANGKMALERGQTTYSLTCAMSISSTGSVALIPMSRRSLSLPSWQVVSGGLIECFCRMPSPF